MSYFRAQHDGALIATGDFKKSILGKPFDQTVASVTVSMI